MRRKTLVLLLIVIVLATGALAFFWKRTGHMGITAGNEFPTATVHRASLQMDIYTDGDLRSVHTAVLLAPPVSGSLQILKLLRTGTSVKKDDVILQFDSSEQQYKLEQAQFDLAAAQQEVLKAKADSEVQQAQDQVALLKARFDVRRAELDVGRNELVSSIDAQKNNLALDEARRRLAQLEQDVKSRQVSNAAAVAVSEEKRNKATLSIHQAQDAMGRMTIKAPLAGIVTVRENTDAMGGIVIGGVPLPEYREGDVVRPGNTIAEVYDPGDLEIQGKIAESDRANISSGQVVKISVDAVPDLSYSGKVKNIASMTSRGMWWNSGSMRKFDASFTLDKTDSRLRPGQSTQVIIEGKIFKDVLVVPRQAIFERNGNPIVYTRSGNRFEARDVKIVARTESRAAIEGVSEGTEVTLVNPQKQPEKKSAAGQARPMMGGAVR